MLTPEQELEGRKVLATMYDMVMNVKVTQWATADDIF